jgi:hypothetical protein
MADIRSIVEQLKAERDRISRAIDALESVNGTASRTRGMGRRKRRKMSAEARAKIAAAQRARWAKQKRAAKQS